MAGPTLFSRFRFCSGIIDDAANLILTDPEPYTAAQSDDVTFTSGEGDTLTTIAFAQYGRADLWWVVADRLAVSDPTQPIAPGTVVTIPSRRTVTELILNESRRVDFEA